MMRGNSQEEPSFAENLDRFNTGRDLTLQDGNVEAMERWMNVLQIPELTHTLVCHEGVLTWFQCRNHNW